jgi:hypothetical protein
MTLLTRPEHEGVPIARRRIPPVVCWASVGVLSFAVFTLVWIAWFASGDASPTPRGATAVPLWMSVAIRVQEVTTVLALLAYLRTFVIRPWRRLGSPTSDGLIVLALLTLYWQDPLLNYRHIYVTYNAGFVNLGSWAAHIPGWQSAQASRLAEPLLWEWPLYVVALFSLSLVANRVMDKARARWPQISKIGLIAICYGFFIVSDVVIEPLLMVFGFSTYPSTIPWLTIFGGRYFQFPLYEAFILGAFWTGIACLRYFRDDHGHTFAERGIDPVPARSRRSTWLRFFGLAGALNTMMLLLFVLPSNVVSPLGGAWPHDIVDRSYLRNGFCGVEITPCRTERPATR